MNRTRSAVAIVVVVLGAIILLAIVVKWRGGSREPESTKAGSPPVFDSDVYLEEGTPPAKEILAALSSGNQQSIWSAHILLKRIVSKDKLRWPSNLRKQDVYKHIGRHLKSNNLKIVESAITVVDPRSAFGKGFYRSEEDVRAVQRAIKRWNATQSEEDDFYQFYELLLNDKGEPVRLKRRMGMRME